MEPIITSEKSYKIQICRGVAILAVVFVHNTPLGLCQLFCRPFINFGVAVFLFLSGTLSSIERWNPKKRIKKVIIPYLIYSALYSVLQVGNNLSLFWGVYFKSLFLADSAPQMYYIFVYCQITLLIPFSEWLSRTRAKVLGLFLSPFYLFVTRYLFVVLRIPSNHIMDSIRAISCLAWFSYFYLGYILSNGTLKLSLSKRIIVSMIPISIGLQLIEGYILLSYGSQSYGTQYKLSTMLTNFLIVLVCYFFINSSSVKRYYCFKVFGDYSFGIYFVHILPMIILERYQWYNNYLKFPFNAIISFTFSLGFVVLIHRVLGNKAKLFAI